MTFRRNFEVVVLGAAAGLAIYAAPALADAAVADADPTAVPLKPLFDFLQPLFITIASAFASIAVPVLSVKLFSLMHINLTATQQDMIREKAATGAAALAASSTAGFADEVIHVGDKRVADIANKIIAEAPKELTALGVTPANIQGEVQHIVLGEIGKAQMAAPTPTTAAPLVTSRQQL